MKRIISIIRQNMNLIAISAASFAIGVPLGLITYPLVSDRMTAILAEAFGGILEGTTPEIILNVFIRNTSASLIILLLGMTVLLALLSLALNGLLVGLVFRFAVDKGLNVGNIVLGIIPHGIFELPALFISAALGVRVGVELLTQRGRRLKSTAQALREASAVYLTIVIPLLMVAAVMEILVSKNLI